MFYSPMGNFHSLQTSYALSQNRDLRPRKSYEILRKGSKSYSSFFILEPDLLFALKE